MKKCLLYFGIVLLFLFLMLSCSKKSYNDINLKKDIKDDTVNEELSDNKTKKVATKKKTTTKKTTTKKATTKNKKDEGDE